MVFFYDDNVMICDAAYVRCDRYDIYDILPSHYYVYYYYYIYCLLFPDKNMNTHILL